MNIKHNYRNIFLFYICLGIIFILAATTITAYSLGYRYNFTKKEIVKTGILRLSPTENDYKIYIEDEEISKTLIKKTTEIPDLLPGEYNIKIIFDNYQEWNKKIKILPNLITNENNIWLIPETVIAEKIALIKNPVANDQLSQIAYVNIDTIQILNVATQKITSYPEIIINNSNHEIKWLSDDLLSVIYHKDDKTNLYLVNINNNNVSLKTVEEQINAENILGHYPLQPNTILIYKDNNIYYLDTTSITDKILLFEKVLHPNIIDNNLYFYQTENGKTTIDIHNLIYNSNNTIEFDGTVTNLFPTTPSDYLIVNTDKNTNRIIPTSLTTSIEDLDKFSYDIKQVLYNQHRKYILLKTNNDITILKLQNYPKIESSTILRLTKKIHQCWRLDSDNIIYTTDDGLFRINNDGQNNQMIKSSTGRMINIVGASSKYITITEITDEGFLLQNLDIKGDLTN